MKWSLFFWEASLEMPHAIWILHRAKTTGTRVRVLLKGIGCSGSGRELLWQCKVSPLMFTKGTLLSQSLGSAAWEASKITRKQTGKSCSFGVAHKLCVRVAGTSPWATWKCVMWHAPEELALLCCLGEAGLLAGAAHQTWARAPRCLRSYLPGGEKLERSGLSLGTKFKCQHSEPFYNLSVWCLSLASYHSARDTDCSKILFRFDL